MTTQINRADTGDPRYTAQRREEGDSADRQIQRDMLAVLQTEAGRRTMWWVMHTLCRMDEQAYTRDSDMTAFQEGARSIAVRVKKMIKRVSNTAYGNMEHEAALYSKGE